MNSYPSPASKESERKKGEKSPKKGYIRKTNFVTFSYAFTMLKRNYYGGISPLRKFIKKMNKKKQLKKKKKKRRQKRLPKGYFLRISYC